MRKFGLGLAFHRDEDEMAGWAGLRNPAACPVDRDGSPGGLVE